MRRNKHALYDKKLFEARAGLSRAGSFSGSEQSSDIGASGHHSHNVDISSIAFQNESFQIPPSQIQRRGTFLPIRSTNSSRSLLDNDSIELNVGGTLYTTSGWILAREQTSWLTTNLELMTTVDRRGRYFIDRDGEMFNHVLTYLRTGELHIPKDFTHLEWLSREADFYGLKVMKCMLDKLKQNRSCSYPYKGTYITLTEHATYDVKLREYTKVVFKRISSMTVAGHVKTCRKVLGSYLSFDRDAHDNQDRYSCRMVLTQGCERSVFDILKSKGYELITNCKTDAANFYNNKSSEQVILTRDQHNYQTWNHVTCYHFRRK